MILTRPSLGKLQKKRSCILLRKLVQKEQIWIGQYISTFKIMILRLTYCKQTATINPLSQIEDQILKSRAHSDLISIEQI